MNTSIKKVPCHICNGRGIISYCSENSISCETCSECNGIGYHFEPITVSDDIRAMSDEKLAEKFVEFFIAGAEIMVEGVSAYFNKDKAIKMIIEQLQQPLNENWREEIVKPVSKV